MGRRLFSISVRAAKRPAGPAPTTRTEGEDDTSGKTVGTKDGATFSPTNILTLRFIFTSALLASMLFLSILKPVALEEGIPHFPEAFFRITASSKASSGVSVRSTSLVIPDYVI